MKEILIEIKNYSYSIGETRILSNISLVINQGDYISIIGPNGAGKSTLLKCLDRILTGGKGEIRLKGKLLEKYSQKELARLTGYVPQTSTNIFPFNVHEFVLMGRYSYMKPFSATTIEDEEAVNNALLITGTKKWESRLMTTLSGGERQKVLIAGALAQGAEILLLDEPTTFLDPYYQDEIYSILEQINKESGVTILSATHDINSAAFYGRDIIAIKNGVLVFRGSSLEIMNNNILGKVFGKLFLFAAHPENGFPVVVPGAQTHE